MHQGSQQWDRAHIKADRRDQNGIISFFMGLLQFLIGDHNLLKF